MKQKNHSLFNILTTLTLCLALTLSMIITNPLTAKADVGTFPYSGSYSYTFNSTTDGVMDDGFPKTRTYSWYSMHQVQPFIFTYDTSNQFGDLLYLQVSLVPRTLELMPDSVAVTYPSGSESAYTLTYLKTSDKLDVPVYCSLVGTSAEQTTIIDGKEYHWWCENYGGALHFDTYQDAIDYLYTYYKSGATDTINPKEIDLETDGIYDASLDRPDFHIISNDDGTTRDFLFSNASSDYYVEIKGRWWSVDDIELYKDSLMWKYKYSSLIKNDLTTWVSVSDKLNSVGTFNFSTLGDSSFQNLLTTYPVDSRNFSGGTNLLGNYLSGYNDALDTIKMLLNSSSSVYVGVEVYARYYCYDDDGNVYYSKWTHYYDNLASESGSSGSQWDDKENMFTENESESGLTTDDMNSLESSGNSRNDSDTVSNYIIESSSLTDAATSFFETLHGMFNGMGQFPALVTQVFGWMPSWLISLIALSLAAIIIMRFIGR